ncbi:hypothetical protein [Pannonibacter phragmitetus]|uniref:hypothetical protein n=1 Tax=Pannonibacter phragmitetus TaxID=121719 RepID=UPI001AD8E8B8|nr:hypothetical protein [Pannonibacter phragmitetus]
MDAFHDELFFLGTAAGKREDLCDRHNRFLRFNPPRPGPPAPERLVNDALIFSPETPLQIRRPQPRMEPGMQLSIQTTTTSASLLSVTQSSAGASGNPAAGKAGSGPSTKDSASTSLLEAAAKKAEEDAVVINALRDAAQKGKTDEKESGKKSLASIEDYTDTANKIRSAIGENASGSSGSASVAYESATITETLIEGEIGGQKISASFVSYDRVSYDSATGLSARSASSGSINVSGNGVSSSYQSASVSSLYAGTREQIGTLLSSAA